MIALASSSARKSAAPTGETGGEDGPVRDVADPEVEESLDTEGHQGHYRKTKEENGKRR